MYTLYSILFGVIAKQGNSWILLPSWEDVSYISRMRTNTISDFYFLHELNKDHLVSLEDVILLNCFFLSYRSSSEQVTGCLLLLLLSPSLLFGCKRGCGARGTYVFGFSPLLFATFASCTSILCTLSSTVFSLFFDEPHPMVNIK